MKIADMFDSGNEFRSEGDVKQSIKRSKNYKGEDPSEAHLLNIFGTSKQRTYLVATPKRLYCILDDTRKDEPHINWSMPKEEILSQEGLKLNVATKDKTNDVGLVDVGSKHTNWLFSKAAFKEKDIKSSIEELLKTAMKDD